MTRSFLGLFILVLGYGAAMAVLVSAAFWLHVVLGFVAFLLVCAGVARGLNSLFAEDRPPEPAEAYCADEGADVVSLRGCS